MQECREGIDTLGSAARGEWALQVHAEADASAKRHRCRTRARSAVCRGRWLGEVVAILRRWQQSRSRPKRRDSSGAACSRQAEQEREVNGQQCRRCGADWWNTDQYHMATRMRQLRPPTCALTKHRTGERHDVAMRRLLTHFQLCKCGLARQMHHTALKRTLTMELRRMHFDFDVERVVPFFSAG